MRLHPYRVGRRRTSSLEWARMRRALIELDPRWVSELLVKIHEHFAYVGSSDRWRRTWQCEWSGCAHAPRAWTERGVRRKAARWIQHSLRS